MKRFLNWLFPPDKVQENWDKRGMNLIRLLVEFDNGEVRELEGDAANEWWHDHYFKNCGRTVDWSRHKFKITKHENTTNPTTDN
jgi:hypothetical protein